MEKERKKETRRHYVSICRSIETVFHQRYTIQQSDKKSKDPVQIDERKRQILVNKNPLFSRKVSERRLMEEVLILFEVAYRLSRNKTSVYSNFYRLVAELE